ncbi:hypothetical protein BM529_16210, partial [Clostridioides difficile]
NKQNTSNSEEIVYFTPKVRVITLQKIVVGFQEVKKYYQAQLQKVRKMTPVIYVMENNKKTTNLSIKLLNFKS